MSEESVFPGPCPSPACYGRQRRARGEVRVHVWACGCAVRPESVEETWHAVGLAPRERVMQACGLGVFGVHPTRDGAIAVWRETLAEVQRREDDADGGADWTIKILEPKAREWDEPIALLSPDSDPWIAKALDSLQARVAEAAADLLFAGCASYASYDETPEQREAEESADRIVALAKRYRVGVDHATSSDRTALAVSDGSGRTRPLSEIIGTATDVQPHPERPGEQIVTVRLGDLGDLMDRLDRIDRRLWRAEGE